MKRLNLRCVPDRNEVLWECGVIDGFLRLGSYLFSSQCGGNEKRKMKINAQELNLKINIQKI